mmetsp:Transcript_27875/g.72979  ORF Transcript_27875/g.72979 Transcript_27875/m.72979 type:complete len:316 (+) Transcript_27875:709-1656(+)
MDAPVHQSAGARGTADRAAAAGAALVPGAGGAVPVRAATHLLAHLALRGSRPLLRGRRLGLALRGRLVLALGGRRQLLLLRLGEDDPLLRLGGPLRVPAAAGEEGAVRRGAAVPDHPPAARRGAAGAQPEPHRHVGHRQALLVHGVRRPLGGVEGGVGGEGLAGGALVRDHAPVLLVEDAVREGAAAGGHAPRLLAVGAAARVLPPLVRELEDQAAQAHAPRVGGVRHDLAEQGHGGLCLVGLVLGLGEFVVGVGPELGHEHRLLGAVGPEIEEVAEADSRISREPPDVYIVQIPYLLWRRHHSVHRCNRVARVG